MNTTNQETVSCSNPFLKTITDRDVNKVYCIFYQRVHRVKATLLSEYATC